MAMIQYKPILEFDSKSDDDGTTLETWILEDFGEQGLAAFKDHEVGIQAPINTGHVVRFNYLGELKRGYIGVPDNKIIGKIYNVSTKEVKEIGAKDVNARLDLYSPNEACMSLTLDLKTDDESCRYLKLLFHH